MLCNQFDIFKIQFLLLLFMSCFDRIWKNLPLKKNFKTELYASLRVNIVLGDFLMINYSESSCIVNTVQNIKSFFFSFECLPSKLLI